MGLLRTTLPLLAASASAAYIPHKANASSPQYFITFGDSYSQTGFNVTTGPLPSVSNPFGNPTYPGYTTAGGANWIGDLVFKYNATTLLNYNFAYGGATTDATLVTPYQPTVLSLVDQVSEFSNSIAKQPVSAPWTSENTLFGIWIGVNDVGNSWYLDGEDARIGKIMSQITNQTSVLYAAGGRNFVFLTVPPIQRTPSVMASCDSACQASEAKVISTYNSQLNSALKNFTSAHPLAKITVVDTQTPFNAALDNPTAYGASATGASCYNSDGKTCLWWNDYHPGLAIQDAVAKVVAGQTGLSRWFKKAA